MTRSSLHRLKRAQVAFISLAISTLILISCSVTIHALGNPALYVSKGYRTIYIVPHTHFDPYWLDPWNTEVERWSQNVRNALDLMGLQPSMCFVLDQVVGIKYFWEHYPDYQSKILQFLREGRLEIVQGFVSQPDMNLPGEEGLIEDAEIGNEWVRSTLGVNPTVGWEIDPFGFGIGTPTFFNDCGLKYLVITRSATPLQNGLFRWTGTDNSSILGFYYPTYSQDFGNAVVANIAYYQGINEFFKRISDLINSSSPEYEYSINAANLTDPNGDMLVLYGADFTNPNPLLVDYVTAWNAMYASQTGYVCKIGTPSEYFDRMQSLIDQGGIVKQSIPSTRDLNPVFNGGFYTTYSEVKAAIQQFEDRLNGEQTFAAITKQVLPTYTYPQDDFWRIWYDQCVSHHHDSITGTSYLPVQEDNYHLLSSVVPTLDRLESSILGNLSSRINLNDIAPQSIPLVVFNPSSWNRTDVIATNITVDIPGIVDVNVWDPDAATNIPCQILPIENSSMNTLSTFTILFVGTIPSMGYKTYYLHPLTSPNHVPAMNLSVVASGQAITVKNQYYRLSFNATGKNALQIWDTKSGWQIFKQGTPGSELQEYYDNTNQYSYGLYGLESNVTAQVPVVSVLESGPVRVQLALHYISGHSSYTRIISMYDTLRRIDFDETMNFQPSANTSLLVRWSFNETKPIYTYNDAFGSIVHNQSRTVYPALYSVDVSNGSVGAAVIAAAIHGFRINGAGLEAILVRYMHTPKTTTNTANCPDNGTWDFRYCITSYDPSNATEVNNQQLLAYQFNFRTYALQTVLHTGPLLDTTSFFVCNASNVIIQGLRKDYGSNQWCFQVQNMGSTATNVAITSELHAFGTARFATLANQPLGSCPETNGSIQISLGPHAWQSILTTPVLNASIEDINGPSISSIIIDNPWYGTGIQLSVRVDDAEGSSIQSVQLQYCFNETFEGQQWSSLPMTLQADGSYAITVPISILTERPVYFRVVAMDSQHDLGYSTSLTVMREPAFSPLMLGIAIVIVIAIVCLVGWLLRRQKRGNLRIKAILTRLPRESIAFAGWMAFGVGLWVYAWAVSKGLLGTPQITSIYPGDFMPSNSVEFPWSMTPHNSIFDFYSLWFLFGTMIVAFILVMAWQLWHRHLLRFRDGLWGILGAVCFPLVGVIFLPVLDALGGFPASTTTQLFSPIELFYAAFVQDILPTIIWIGLPLLVGAVVAVILWEIFAWTWRDVLPARIRAALGLLIAGAVEGMRRLYISNRQVKTTTELRDGEARS